MASVRYWVMLATVLVAGLTIAACSSGAARTAPKNLLQTDYQNVVRKVLPSVVEIDAGKTVGSGVVFDNQGDIVTNAHVVGSAKKFDVFIAASSSALPARLVGMFAPDDLAVIKVTKGSADLAPARWANSAGAQVGDIVLAMGSPYGLADSVTQGIVSATGRTVLGPTISGQPPTVIVNAIQTSAAINPGNSGGALVMLSGLVLGIPTLSAVDPDIGNPALGIGFAIPASTVRDIAGQLISAGRVTRSDRASLQITGETHTSKAGAANGVSVSATLPGGAAAGAGIRTGDVIVGVQGRPTPTLTELETVLADYPPGQAVTVKTLRGDKSRQVRVTLGTLTSAG